MNQRLYEFSGPVFRCAINDENEQLMLGSGRATTRDCPYHTRARAGQPQGIARTIHEEWLIAQMNFDRVLRFLQIKIQE
jgi:hypothetical protein